MNFQTMNISAFAKLCGVTPRTLKHYEDCGLLRPAAVGKNGYREYTLSQVDRVSAILLLRDHGFSLAEIRELLSHGDLPSLKRQLELQKEILREKKARLEQQERYLECTHEHLTKAMLYGEEPFEEEMEPRRVQTVLYDEPPELVIVSYACDGFQSGALFDPRDLRLRGTYQTDAAGDLLLSGRRLCVYSRAMPPDWKTAMRSLLDAFAERTTAKPDFVYSETVIDEFSLGDGLMFYYLFLPE